MTMIRQRPDVRAAERQLALETARIGIETANYYPRLQWSASLGLNSSQLQNLFSNRALTYSLGPSLDFALLDFPQIGARIAAQNATMRAALANFDQTVLQALEETENALSAYAYESQRLESLKNALTARRNARTHTQKRVSAGIGSLLDMIEADRALVEAERNYADSEALALLRLIEVYRAFGGNVSVPENHLYQIAHFTPQDR